MKSFCFPLFSVVTTSAADFDRLLFLCIGKTQNQYFLDFFSVADAFVGVYSGAFRKDSFRKIRLKWGQNKEENE